MRLFITGGAGFIGSNFIRHVLSAHPDWQVVNLDALTYAGNLGNLEDVSSDGRYRFRKGDITRPEDVKACLDPQPDAIVNFAAESHVDRSIEDASSFVRTNVMGTQVLLEAARRHKVDRFLQVSTDEVYGSLGPSGAFREDSPLQPNSPYAASKAGADLLVRSYQETFKLDTVITRCSNNYGPYQFPEKLIPLMLLNALDDKELPVYGDGLYTRDWIHVDDHCRALVQALVKGRSGAVYNIGAEQEEKNIDIVKRILDEVDKPRSLIRFVKDRPGHDRRYAIDARRARTELDWNPQVDFAQGLRQTIDWYRNNPSWVDQVRSGEYQNYYRRMYDQRDQTLSTLE
ncbi:MAG TPA: dTDP-glucose 4,6-dehydratase [Acidobacteriota bacterium]|nr:dTDP-glucose 4,6-dehydratase [Acidobacteriota bacterium]